MFPLVLVIVGMRTALGLAGLWWHAIASNSLCRDFLPGNFLLL